MDVLNSNVVFDTLCDEFHCARSVLAKRLEVTLWVENAYLLELVMQMEENHPVVESWFQQRYDSDSEALTPLKEEIDEVHLECFKRAFWLDSMDSIREKFEIYLWVAGFDYHWAIKALPLDAKLAMKTFLHGLNTLHECLGILLMNGIFENDASNKKNKEIVARKGGVVRAERNKPVKSEVVRLLYKNSVLGRWKNKKDAINSIEKELWDFITHLRQEIEMENNKLPTYKQTRHAPGLSRDSLHRLLMDWSRNDELVGNAFNKVILEKK